MSALSDRLERANYSLVWTAHVVLEVRWGVGDAIVTRRRRSVFVGEKSTAIDFPANDVMGQMPIAKQPPAGKIRLSQDLKGPTTRWFVTSQAPILVLDVRLLMLCENGDLQQIGPHETWRSNAVQGTIIVPRDHVIRFELGRDASWIESCKGAFENGK